MNRTTTTIVFVAAGAAIGVLSAILFAPAKGEDLRKNIRAKGQKLVSELQEKMGRQRGKVNETKEEILETMREAKSNFA